MSKTLTTADIECAVASLGVESCVLCAVIAVESFGSGFLPDDRVKILFEGHVFWKELRKRGIDPAPPAFPAFPLPLPRSPHPAPAPPARGSFFQPVKFHTLFLPSSLPPA